MGSVEIQQTTETMYRFRCHTCDRVGNYWLEAERARTQGLVHEQHLCPGRPKKQRKVKKSEVL